MAFDNSTNNGWKQAFDADFIYAFILAIFLLFNGLALADFLYQNSKSTTGFFNNLFDDSFESQYEICMDEMEPECPAEALPENILEITFTPEKNKALINNKVVTKYTINSELNDEINTELTKIKAPINQTINSTIATKLVEVTSSITTVSNTDNSIQPNKFNNKNTITTTTLPQKTVSKNQLSITSESYIYPAPIVATPRPTNVRKVMKHLTNYTSHTNITTPQNKTFIKAEKNLGTTSKIDLETLPELSFLLSDLIATANLQGKNIILSFGAKWCLPCKQMDKNVYGNEEVSDALQADYLFQKLNEKDLETITLKNLFDVKVYPTTLIVDTNGNVVNRYEESISKDRMMNILAENTNHTTMDEVIVKVDSFSQPIELEAGIDFLVSRAENSTLDFD